MWIGHAHEGAADEAGAWSPLREIKSLCGLALGGYDAFGLDDLGGENVSQPRKCSQRLALVTLDGNLVGRDDDVVDADGISQRALAKHPRAGR